ncbi:hypothetical protein JOC76_000969 [Neobacillus cucumis]|nr:hypothetical protein [Neobacillus cucumis]
MGKLQIRLIKIANPAASSCRVFSMIRETFSN